MKEVTHFEFYSTIIDMHLNLFAVQFGTFSTCLTIQFSGQSFSTVAVLPCGVTGKDKYRACSSLEGRYTNITSLSHSVYFSAHNSIPVTVLFP